MLALYLPWLPKLMVTNEAVLVKPCTPLPPRVIMQLDSEQSGTSMVPFHDHSLFCRSTATSRDGANASSRPCLGDRGDVPMDFLELDEC